MSPLIKKIAVLALFALIQLPLLAQEGPPAPQRTPPIGLPMPIDGDIIFLVIAGIALGIFFAVKNKSKRNVA